MKREIIVAKSAGFCFGVKRAVGIAEDFAEKGIPAVTLGEIIHNPTVVEGLRARGVFPVESVSEVPEGATLILRSHGVPLSVVEELEKKCIPYADATCPFVARIHRIVAERTAAGDTVIITGNPDHAEVRGIVGHAKGDVRVVRNLAELEELSKNEENLCAKCITIVSQTTFLRAEWEKCEKFAKKVYTNLLIFDTICNDACTKQSEADALSRRCNGMIVVGGRNSSNTARLWETCAANCPTVLIEYPSELKPNDWNNCEVIGVTAGASTPYGIIKEVLQTMSENKEISFEEMLEQSFEKEESKYVRNGEKVQATVMVVKDTEIVVSVGSKHTGFVSSEELSEDPNVKPADIVKVGDEITLKVLHVNDADGTMTLSKKKVDAEKNFQAIEEAAGTDEILEGTVVEVVKGGVIVVTDGVRVFIPASQATASRNEALEGLLKQNVKFRVLEVNAQRKRAIGSIKSVLNEERKARQAAFWENVEVGQVFEGKVKSLTSYGAFVDLGGVDGMVHVSELSWLRVAKPADVVSVGDTLEVFVKDVDKEAKKISLGYKKEEDNPWEILKRDYPVGTVAKAKIVSMTAFGAFANLIPGIDGLIHISQISYERVAKPEDVLSVGQEVDVKITDIDFDKHRVSFSIKALLEPPVKEEAAEEAPVEE
ncbi:MAG: bifunctional 4-hydroxy-3-methylbut-2-enyl diphosphate reductase/30S ribosomal protein S1 [Oscillospiraceae bacterium]|nr:bifunctional 4-hydroxy-3-methylbut-2-enyl diphosphate reductase/30S ribosomal protein S1 [Oscillospiraceae bacterium]MBP1575284.1 bifunctional 4-hydroxy-3-methylbut-2-enyl diphosphate reductase/30S ribosomal protein S1 [Oscillospiraceae bacterium]